MEGWEGFFLAQAGASAALAGLIFVGVSINLTKIMEGPGLPGRAFEALLLLFGVLVLSSFALVPGQSATILGLEVLGIGLVVWGLIAAFQISYLRTSLGNLSAQFRRYFAGRVALTQVATLPIVAGGVVLLLDGNTYNGIYWLVPGVIFSFVVVLISSWVLLIEINR